VKRPFIKTTLALLTATGLLPVLPAAGQSSPATGSLDITVTGARSDKGLLRIALCPPSAGFPDCGDKAVRTASLPIVNGKARLVFSGLHRGNYAVSVFHDANGNGKLDTFVGIPREGYGFSRNPPFKPRAPRWSEAVITLSGEEPVSISLRYLL